MTRLGLAGILLGVLCPTLALGQTMSHSGPKGFTQYHVTKQRVTTVHAPVMNTPPVTQPAPIITAGFVSGGHHHHHHHHGWGYQGGYRQFYYGPVYFVPSPWQQTAQPMPFPMPVQVVPDLGQQTDFSMKKEPKPSSPGAQKRSIELQIKADQKLREQKWSEARAIYSESVSAAPDRAAAHVSLAISYMSISQFDLAVRELKRAIRIEPEIVLSGKKLEQVFGPNSKIVRNSIISKVAHWVRADKDSSDRLFLLGAILFFDGDARAREHLDASMKFNSSGSTLHITAFLNSINNQDQSPPQPAPDGKPNPAGVPLDPLPAADGVPPLKDLPSTPTHVMPKFSDVRFPKSFVPIAESPVPQPEGLSGGR